MTPAYVGERRPGRPVSSETQDSVWGIARANFPGPMSTSAEAVRDLFDRKSGRFSAGYDRGGVFAARPRMFVEALSEFRSPPAAILDFGCGTGHIAQALSQTGYRVSGCDVSAGMVAEGQHRFGDVTLTVLPAGWTRLPYADGTFEVAVASSVLEYVEDLSHVLGELARVLKTGGLFLATVPNLRHPRRWVEAASARALTWAPVNALAEAVPKVALHARYLRTSRNRFPAAGWAVTFAAAGFAVRSTRLAASPMLELFVLERR